MKEFKVLKLLDKFHKIFASMGIDYFMMRKILQCKLTMDARRVPTIMKNNKRKKKDTMEQGNKFLRSLWVYALLSLVIIPSILLIDNFTYSVSITFSIILFLLMSTLISDFSSVLLDVRDKNILMIRPIDPKTINAAKVLHILIYLFYVTLAIAGLPTIAGLIRYGMGFFLIFVVELILLDIIAIVFVGIFYLAILRFFDGEKLRDMINYVQIGLVFGITIGYQLVLRLFSIIGYDVAFEPKWWQFLLIPVWFSGPFEVILHKNFHPYYIVFSLLALIVPLILIFVYNRMVPVFERNLNKLNKLNSIDVKDKFSLVKFLGRRWIKDREIRAIYLFTCSMFKSEREFKLKIYPSLGLGIAFPFIFLMSFVGKKGFDFSTSNTFLNIYYCALMLPTIIIMLGYSEKYKGAWIYEVLPIQHPKTLMRGAFLVSILQYILPVFVIESIVFVILYGTRIILDLTIVAANMGIYTFVIYMMNRKKKPFSEAMTMANNSGSGIRNLVNMFVLMIFAGAHYLLLRVDVNRVFYLVITLLIATGLWIWTFRENSEKKILLRKA